MNKMIRMIADKNTFFVLLGVFAGLFLVFISLIESRVNPVTSKNIIAMVNGRPIHRSLYETMVSTLNDERDKTGRPLVDADRVLNRMIEEELLVQRAIELGLPYSDKITRGYLSQHMINIITKDVSKLTPDKSSLKKFYKNNKYLFTNPDRIALDFRYIKGKDDNSRERAEMIKKNWISAAPESSPFTDKLPIPIPSGYLDLRKLADYVGMEYAEYFFSIDAGSISKPVSYLDGWLLARISGKENMQPPEFDAVEQRVLAVFKQTRADEAVNEYLQDLKRSAEIKTYEKP